MATTLELSQSRVSANVTGPAPLPVLLLASGIKVAGTDISGVNGSEMAYLFYRKLSIILYESPGSLLPHFIALGKDLDTNGKDKRHGSCLGGSVLCDALSSIRLPCGRQCTSLPFLMSWLFPVHHPSPPLPASDLFSVHLCFVWKDELSGVYCLGSPYHLASSFVWPMRDIDGKREVKGFVLLPPCLYL